MMVQDVMRKKVQTTEFGTSIVDAVKIMEEHSIGSLVIVKGEEAAGIVTSTDVLYKGIAKGKDLEKTAVEEIMSSPLITIGPGNSLQDAAKMMGEHSIKKLPVIAEDGELVGIITASDLISKKPELFNVLVNLMIPEKQKGMGG